MGEIRGTCDSCLAVALLLWGFSIAEVKISLDRGQASSDIYPVLAALAQSVEQRTENPCVRSSILRGGIKKP